MADRISTKTTASLIRRLIEDLVSRLHLLSDATRIRISKSEIRVDSEMRFLEYGIRSYDKRICGFEKCRNFERWRIFEIFPNTVRCSGTLWNAAKTAVQHYNAIVQHGTCVNFYELKTDYVSKSPIVFGEKQTKKSRKESHIHPTECDSACNTVIVYIFFFFNLFSSLFNEICVLYIFLIFFFIYIGVLPPIRIRRF